MLLLIVVPHAICDESKRIIINVGEISRINPTSRKSRIMFMVIITGELLKQECGKEGY